MYPDAFGAAQPTQGEPQSGGIAAAKAGYQNLKGDIAALAGRTGIMDEAAAEQYKAEREAEAKKIFRPTEKGWTEAPLTKLAELGGGSLPYMAAPLAAGALGAMAPVAGAGVGAAGLASLAQFTGSNLSRQMEEGKKLGETSLGSAAAAAVPQAALDMLSFKMAPGIRNIFAAAGKEVPEKLAEQIAKQGTANMLKDYGVATAKSMGAEGLTEAGQQFFERLQAGLNLTDEQARDEYWQNLIGGAVLGGAIAPAGRYAERSKLQGQQEDEAAKKAQADRLTAAAEEKTRRESPDYAREVEANYLALEKQREDLKSQLIKINKESPTLAADREHNRGITKQLEELTKNEIAPAAKEYNVVKPILNQIKEQERLAATAPEDVMLEHLGVNMVERGEKIKEKKGRMPGALAAIPKEPEYDLMSYLASVPDEAPNALDSFATERKEAALTPEEFNLKQMGQPVQPNLGRLADTILEQPGTAMSLIKSMSDQNNPYRIAGLSKGENAALLSGLKQRVKDTNAIEFAQREADLQNMQPKGPTVDQLDMFKSSTEQVEEQRATGETNFDYLDPIFEKALEGKAPVVAVNAAVRPSDKAPAVRARIDKLAENMAQAERDARQARSIKEYAAAEEADARRDAARREMESLSAQGDEYAKTLIPLRQKQDAALAQLEETTQRLKADETLGTDEQGKMASATRESLATRAANHRAEFIKSSLEEAALNRRAAGKPALTQDEAIKAASKLYDTVNDWVERAATQAQPAQYEEQIVQPAQMRADKVVRPAVTKRVEVKPAVKGISPAEVKHFKARIDAVRKQLVEAAGEPTRETPLLKTQFAASEAKKVAEARGENATTLGGELRRRTEYVRDKMSRMKGMRPMAAAALNKAADVMDAGKASREVLDKTEALVDAINNGLQVRQVDVQALNDALAASAPTAIEQKEAGQKALFAETEKDIGYIRANAKNFENSPAVRKARAALDMSKKFQEAEAKRKEAADKVEVEKRNKRINELEEQIDEAKGDYADAFRTALGDAIRTAKDARDAVLDPLIAKTQKELDEAAKGLVQALKENEAATRRFNAVLAQKQGANRTELATYELLRMEEQKSLAEDYKKQLEEAQKTLDNAVAERLSEVDHADFAVEAVLNGNVKLERKHWLKLEKRLAELKKVESPANAAERAVAQQELRAQEAIVLTAEKKRIEEMDRAKRQRDALEARLQKGEGVFVTRDDKGVITKVEKKGLTGIRVIGGRKEALVTDEEKYNERLREQAMQQLIDNEELARRKDLRNKQAESIESELEDLYKEWQSYGGPVDVAEINAAIASMKTTSAEREMLREKLDVWKEIQSLEAQAEALAEGKPRRKQRAATVDTTAKQAANKGFMSGSPDAIAQRQFEESSREEQRAANKAAQEARGKKAAPEPTPNTRKQGRMLDEDIGLFDEYDLTNTTSAQQAQLTDVAKEALRDGRLLYALDDLAINSKLPFIRENAAALRKLVSRTRVIVTDDIEVDGEQAPAAYNSTQNAILIKPDALTEANLIHEATHAATMRAMDGPEDKLNNDQYQAKQELVQMYNDLTEDGTLSGEYAAKNAKEFISEVQSNANLREKLDGRSMLRKVFDALMRLIGIRPAATKTEQAQALIERLYMQSAKLEAKTVAAGQAVYATPEMAAVGALTDKFVAKNKSRTEQLRAAAGGWLGLETQLVDRFAGFERISKTMDALKGSQMMYYLRMYDQRMNFTSQAVENGALKIVEKERADGRKEHVIEATPGASIKGVVKTLNEAKPFVGNGEAVNRLFTMYMSGIRADSKGFDSLNFGEDVTEADLKAATKAVEDNAALKDVFERARNEYNEYNRDMMEFLASTGAISEQTRKQLTQENDYIPWYRENNGVAELMIGGESRVRIGSIAEQPYLHELVGGDRPILDFMTSSVQNTNMLADMGLRNLATKNAVFELVDMDMAKIVGAQTGNNIVKFKVDGKDKYASVETDSSGIPGDLLVKGMEGIPTQMPAIMRVLSLPSRLLRKGVTLSPLYAAKQLFRDSLAAPILTGADFTPVAGALRQINKPTKELLERRGVTGGQIFTGAPEDLTKILRDITDGKSGWLNALAKAEAIGMEADALTRRAQYQSYINQGLSEMEATLMALESMNFNKRGASPSIHMIGAMIPFFNAQIQGLNVLYKAMTGNMPFNERLKIQEKMLVRGGMLAAGTLAYAAMMQDDEAYKNATPDQKYGNWFVRIPGVDEPVRIPVPFEVGYIFKALPEALYNSMVDEHGGEEAVKAFKQILLQTIPGGTSYGIPQALKPAIEAGLGKSFYTGRDLLSAHEKSLLPEEQFRVNTTEAAKIMGKGLGVSPIILEQLVQGYTGPMGLAFLQAVSLGLPAGNTPEQATKRLSEMPLVGGAFQPNDAGGIINATYDRFEDAVKTKRTVDGMMESGRMAEAKELLQKTGNEYMAGEMGDYFTTQMKELTQFENAIRAMNITPAEKRERLDKIKALKISLASASRRTVDRIAPQ